MNDWIRALAPFALALYLMFDSSAVTSGRDWFIESQTKNLEAWKVADADKRAKSMWQAARDAGRPQSVNRTALVTALGVYLLIPDTAPYGELYGVLLFLSALLSRWLANRLHPRATFRADGISLFLVLAGSVGAILKLTF